MDNKEVMNTINKPMSIVREELISGIIGVINNSGLPLYFVEPILKELLNEVSEAAQKQINSEKIQYENAIKAQDAAKKAEDDTEKKDE